MTNRKKLAIWVAGLILLIASGGAVAFIAFKHKEQSTEIISNPIVTEMGEDLPKITLKASFYEENILNSALLDGGKAEKRNDIRAIISPHHFLAADLIAGIVAQSSGRRINNVIIVGPNHNHIGNEPIATTKAMWETPFGYLETSDALVEKFMDDFKINVNLEAFENEHAIGSIAVLVKHYFPQAKLLPVLINSSAQERDAQKISDWLAENTNADDLVIFSMDFSHYLSESQARKSDAYTKDLISRRDLGRILQLNDDFVDSPISLATGMLFAEKMKLQTEFVANENSFNLSADKSDTTTSYFTIRFVQK